MRSVERVLVDTSALYALISSNDTFHRAASEAYTRLLRDNWELWISSYVLVEFGTVVQRRLGFSTLKAFYDSLSGVFQTIWIDSRIHLGAWSELETREGTGLSFVDWTVLLAGRQLGAKIFTFDRGFFVEGAEVIP